MLKHQDTKSNYIEINNRFGTFNVNLDNKIYFPNGLLGMSDFKYFCITRIPSSNNEKYFLFQSIDAHEVSFVTFPASKHNEYFLYSKEDVDILKTHLKTSEEDLLILLIMNFIQNGENIDKCMNLCAPLVIDTNNKIGTQYVFHNSKYAVRHKIT